MLDCINANLKTLHFVESKNISSFEQINNMIAILYDKRNLAQAELNNIRNILKQCNENVVLIDKTNALRNQIELQKNKPDYLLYELENDRALLNSYESILSKHNLIDPIQQEKFKSLIEKYNTNFGQLSNALKIINNQIREYDACVYTLKRIDKDYNKYTVSIKTYDEIKINLSIENKMNTKAAAQKLDKIFKEYVETIQQTNILMKYGIPIDKAAASEYESSKTKLKATQTELFKDYQKIKSSLSEDQKVQVEKYLNESIAEQSADFTNLDLLKAVNQATRELDSKETNRLEREKKLKTEPEH